MCQAHTLRGKETPQAQRRVLFSPQRPGWRGSNRRREGEGVHTAAEAEMPPEKDTILPDEHIKFRDHRKGRFLPSCFE